MLVNKPLEQYCELCILLDSLDLGKVVQCVKRMLIAVVYLFDVWVVDNYVWQELQIHESSGKSFG